jgi:SAM domain (Sterile alpha motif)
MPPRSKRLHGLRRVRDCTSCISPPLPSPAGTLGRNLSGLRNIRIPQICRFALCMYSRRHSRHSHIMAIASPATPTPTMPELSEALERIGLSTYLDILCANGFNTWETVLDITEEDLTALEFKLGHRRALQREIATWRGIPQSLSLNPEIPSSEPTSLSTSALETLARQQSTPPPREKRRYRRHPRADSNAPKKPKTACTQGNRPCSRASLTKIQM